MSTKFGHILSTKDKYFEKNTMPGYLYDLNAEEEILRLFCRDRSL